MVWPSQAFINAFQPLFVRLRCDHGRERRIYNNKMQIGIYSTWLEFHLGINILDLNARVRPVLCIFACLKLLGGVRGICRYTIISIFGLLTPGFCFFYYFHFLLFQTLDRLFVDDFVAFVVDQDGKFTLVISYDLLSIVHPVAEA